MAARNGVRLAKCPQCGEDPIAYQYGADCEVRCCGVLTANRRKWNRYARLTRKGRMFEHMERYVRKHKAKALHGQVSENGKTALRVAYVYLQDARKWWRKRSKK